MVKRGEVVVVAEYKLLKEIRRYCGDACVRDGGYMRILEILAGRRKIKQERGRLRVANKGLLLDQSEYTKRQRR